MTERHRGLTDAPLSRLDRVWVVCAALFLFHAVHNYVWLGRDWPFVFVADRVVLGFSTAWHEYLASSDWWIAAPRYFHAEVDGGVYTLVVGWVSMVTDSAKAIVLTANLPYLALGIWFVYRIGARLGGTPWAGAFSAVFFAGIPSVYAASRRIGKEFPLAGVTAAAVWFLLRSEKFSDRRGSVLFGLAAGAGMMVNYAFAVCIAGPLAVSLFGAAWDARSEWLERRNRDEPLRRFTNLGWALIAAAAVMGVKYLNAETIRSFAMRPGWEAPAAPWHAWANLRVTTAGLIEDHFGALFFILLSLGAAALIRAKGVRVSEKWTLVSWFAIPWLAVTLMSHAKWGRYLLPVTPAAALLFGVGACRLFSRRRWVWLAVLGTAGLFQFYDFSFGLPVSLRNKRLFAAPGRPVAYYRPVDPLLDPMSDYGPGVRRRLETVMRHLREKKTVVLATEEGLFSAAGWRAIHRHYNDRLDLDGDEAWLAVDNRVYDRAGAERLLSKIRAADTIVHSPSGRSATELSEWFADSLERAALYDFQARPGESVSASLKFADFVVSEAEAWEEAFKEATGDFEPEARVFIEKDILVYHRRTEDRPAAGLPGSPPR